MMARKGLDASYEEYLRQPNERAFAVGQDERGGVAWGAAWGMETQYEAIIEAIRRCDKHGKGYTVVSPGEGEVRHKTLLMLEKDNAEIETKIEALRVLRVCPECAHAPQDPEEIHDEIDLLVAENELLQKQLTEETIAMRRTAAYLLKEINKAEKDLAKYAG
eukprot:TRINITY_DN16628_c0_g1_i1.p1 TRINITY_DN16628_c0_g1~~TRINITY_DN16628_c0_g1_i1.p1  ORF type:complete len:162 (+),score=33.09 TRINITY_DN16628_c0_g1_i1:44-529(+)